jgi:hypothetical protein
MVSFFVGALVGSVVTVTVPWVFNWVSDKIAELKSRID